MPDGQIGPNLVKAVCRKYSASGKAQISPTTAPSRTRKRGVSRSSRTLARNAVDAAAPAALMRSQGGPWPVSDRRRGRRTALKRTAKPCGPGARGWRQVGGGVASPTGRANAVNSPMTEARGIRLRGERGISRKTTAQGMPECSDCTCMLVCALFALIARETAGAASTRHSLRPPLSGRNDLQSPGETRRGNAEVCPCRKDFAGRTSMHPA